MNVLDVSIANVSIPTISGDLGWIFAILIAVFWLAHPAKKGCGHVAAG
jgi:hypothetical protein